MIDPVTGWSEITQYDDKRSISIANLVEITWLTRYPIPTDITYDQGSKLISNEFIDSLIEKYYGITAKTSTLVNPIYNSTLKYIFQVLVNIVLAFNMKETYAN